jgi:hypothetical protein
VKKIKKVLDMANSGAILQSWLGKLLTANGDRK